VSTALQLRRAFAELTLRLVRPDLQFVARLLERGAQRGVKLQHGEVSVDHIERFSRSIQSHSGCKRIAPRPRDVEQGQPDLGAVRRNSARVQFNSLSVTRELRA
jgi:hypothetical protein